MVPMLSFTRSSPLQPERRIASFGKLADPELVSRAPVIAGNNKTASCAAERKGGWRMPDRAACRGGGSRRHRRWVNDIRIGRLTLPRLAGNHGGTSALGLSHPGRAREHA